MMICKHILFLIFYTKNKDPVPCWIGYTVLSRAPTRFYNLVFGAEGPSRVVCIVMNTTSRCC
uniref:Uncharacterized protein n=1 Tax=Arundo donax TaxID=35708 RepID=A0A0A9BNR4_ARUDO